MYFIKKTLCFIFCTQAQEIKSSDKVESYRLSHFSFAFSRAAFFNILKLQEQPALSRLITKQQHDVWFAGYLLYWQGKCILISQRQLDSRQIFLPSSMTTEYSRQKRLFFSFLKIKANSVPRRDTGFTPMKLRGKSRA